MPITAAELDIVLKARDDASRTLKSFSGNLGGVERSADSATKALRIMKGVIAALGLALVARAGIRAFKGYIDGAVESAKQFQLVTTQLDAVLRSTGRIAGVTAQDVRKLADEMQRTTMFSDDAVISTSNLLLTFTQISKDVFPDAVRAVADISQAMGQELSQTAIQVGKALNDPILGITALQRVGIQFSDTQKEMIEHFMATNQVAKAQGVILKELETQFGGSAVAAGTTFAGQLKILENRLEDVKKKIGLELLPTFSKLVERFGEPIVLSIESFGAALVEMLVDIGRLAEAWGIVTEGLEEGIDVKPVENFGDAVAEVALQIKLLTIDILYLGDVVSAIFGSIKKLVDRPMWEPKWLMDAMKSWEDFVASRWGEFERAPTEPTGEGGLAEAARKRNRDREKAIEDYKEILQLKRVIREEDEREAMRAPLGPWSEGMIEPIKKAAVVVKDTLDDVGDTLSIPPDTSAWDKAFSDLSNRIRGYLDAAIGHSKRLFDTIGDIMAPGADGPFENIYRAMAVAVHGDEHWAEVLGLDQETAKRIVDKFQRGIFDEEVKALIDMDRLVEIVNADIMAKASMDALVAELAGIAGVGAPVVRAALGMDSPQAATTAKAEVAKLGPMVTDAMKDIADSAAIKQSSLDLGKSVGKGMVKGLMDEATRFKEAIVAMIEDAFEAGKKAAEAFSPSKRFARLGEDIATGMEMGLLAGAARIEQAMAAMVAPPMLPAMAALGGPMDSRSYSINVYTASRDDILDTMGGIGLR